jgi:hypothetical protein
MSKEIRYKTKNMELPEFSPDFYQIFNFVLAKEIIKTVSKIGPGLLA